MRRWDLVSVVLNGVIGAGIFGLPSKVYGLAGDYSLLAFGICALCVAIIVLNFCEWRAAIPGAVDRISTRVKPTGQQWALPLAGCCG